MRPFIEGWLEAKIDILPRSVLRERSFDWLESVRTWYQIESFGFAYCTMMSLDSKSSLTRFHARHIPRDLRFCKCLLQAWSDSNLGQIAASTQYERNLPLKRAKMHLSPVNYYKTCQNAFVINHDTTKIIHSGHHSQHVNKTMAVQSEAEMVRIDNVSKNEYHDHHTKIHE